MLRDWTGAAPAGLLHFVNIAQFRGAAVRSPGLI
jgi:hypothetical protein